MPDHNHELSPVKRALLELRDMRARLEASEHAKSEPLAIVGMGLRLPGAISTVDGFWELLRDGRHAISEVPGSRWDMAAYYDSDPDAPGKMSTRFGGFLDGIDQFDAHFFGITPREAFSMDPQQRLLLEVSWEALEQAGVPPRRLAGTATGVFVGLSNIDYYRMVYADPAGLDGYSASGTSGSVAAGRLSYALGLQGPSLVVDTACSSSLTAVHLACQSLRLGECNLALAGGANVILAPEVTIACSKARMMAADGLCKTFDARADGYVRSEGCGVIVLKRLSDALSNRDPIVALIRGSAVNQDGRSSGLTVPNGPAQEAVIRRALANAGVDPAAVAYVEAHGTGTSLGDPIEVRALGNVFGTNRPAEQPLAIGSVKACVGHLEAAAGIAGLIKVALAFERGEIPGHPQLQQRNPHLDWDALPLTVPAVPMPWPAHQPSRIAGVSSFGFSGTNVHVVLEQAPPVAPLRVGPGRTRHLLAISARSPRSLAESAARYAQRLDTAGADFGDFCFSANTGRVHDPHRVGVVAASAAEAAGLLRHARGGDGDAGVLRGVADAPEPPPLAFLFTGQGSHYSGMGRGLYETEAVYHDAVNRCAGLLQPLMDRPLLSLILAAPGDAPWTDDTACTQPALFALEYALARLWQSWGIEPAAVMGHSVGELVAACVAGVFSLEDGLMLCAARGRLMQQLADDGEMLSVLGDPAAVRVALARHGDLVSVAAINGPGQCVVSGARDVVLAIGADLERRGLKVQRLATARAFHSALMDPVLDELEAVAARIRFAPPTIPLVSSVTGVPARAEDLMSAGYWRRQARDTVYFQQATDTLLGLGHRLFVEIGPAPTLLGMAGRFVADESMLFVPSLRPGRDDSEVMLTSLGTLYVQGAAVNWTSLYPRDAHRTVPVPTSPFERQRYWLPERQPAAAAEANRATADKLTGAVQAAPADCLYEVEWQVKTAAVPAQSATPRRGVWIVVGAGGPVSTAIAGRLEGAGASVVHASYADAYAEDGHGRVSVDPDRGHDVERLIAFATNAGTVALAGIVHVAHTEAPASESIAGILDSVRRGCAALLHMVRPLAAADGAPRTWVVTRGATLDGPAALSQAPVLALVRTLGAEHPQLECVSVDLDPRIRDDETDRLWHEITAPDGENQVAFRGEARCVARLVRYTAAHAVQRLPKKVLAQVASGGALVRAQATYLITGGTGGLGLQLAGFLTGRGATHIVLTSRRPPSDSARAQIAAIEQGGATVIVAPADISREADVIRLVADIAATLPPLAGIIHAAGVVDDGLLAQQDREQFERVLAPKVDGAWHLHRHTATQDLAFFVLFSSAAAVVPSPSQGNYAAANAFLDALAHYRQGLGLPALSINWGPWAEVGMAAALGARDQRRWERLGVRFLAPPAGLSIFERLLDSPAAQVTVLAADWRRFVQETGGGRAIPLLSALVPTQAATPSETRSPGERPSFVEDIERAPESRRRDLVTVHVREQVRQVLALEPSFVLAPHQGLMDLGMDSLMALELRNRLQRSLGRSLPATLTFDRPSVASLADYLATLMGVDAPTARAAAASVPADATSMDPGDAVAVIGIGCRFPGGASDPEQYWQLLCDGVDAIREIPRDRWDIDAYYDANPDAPGKMSTRCGGFIDQVDRFDAPFFGISPREAIGLDPQQRLLLEVSWEALERAGQSPERLLGTRSGVFVGIGTYDYALLQVKQADPSNVDAYFGTGTSLSAAAGRIAYNLGLQGPCMAVDTACSSSLVAVHLACKSLRAGECRLALAGGVNVMLTPEAFVASSRARMLAADGRCKTFDASADGYGRAEGAGVLVLKRLRDAIADGDPVVAVIRGTAVNQDGRSSGLTVPNGPAQQALIREALANAGVAPGAVGYVEAHGTGTSLGDPIEVAALRAVFADARPAGRPLVIGSVKTNIGHLEAAAGVAALTKVILTLQHGAIPPHVHFQTLNPHIDLGESLVIPRERRPWERGGAPRIAGVSSFGFSGTNAHVVVEEAPAGRPAAPGVERPLHLLTASAKTEPALDALVRARAAHLGRSPDIALGDAAFTANAGRAHFDHRLAIVAASRDEAIAALTAAADGVTHAAIRGRGTAGDSAPQVAFLFTGQGSQYLGMGRELYDTQPVFRAALDRCDGILSPLLGTTASSVLYPSASDTSRLDATMYTQPALFALEWSLAELWQSWGIRPAALLGHSIGEYVAACVAGVMTLEDGLRLVAARGRMMQALPGGAMAAVFAEESRVREAIAASNGAIAIAAFNGPEHTVISGSHAAVDSAIEFFAARAIATQRLVVSHAFHSADMDPMLDGYEEVASAISFSTARVPLISNLTGRLAEPGFATASYWRGQVRQPVRFSDGVMAVHSLGCTHWLEVGPTPTLLAMARRSLGEEQGVWLPSLRRSRSDWAQMLDSLAALYVAGAAVDWPAFDRPYRRSTVALPTYPFERQRYWLDGSGLAPATQPAAPADRRSDTPADWLYRVDWTRASADGAIVRRQPGSWLVLADHSGVGDRLARRLHARGDHCERILCGTAPFEATASTRYVKPGDQQAIVAAVSEALATMTRPLAGICHLWSLDLPQAGASAVDLEEGPARAAGSVLGVVQALVAAQVIAPVYVVTGRVHTIAAAATAGFTTAVMQAPVWGIGRTLAVEHPELWGGLFDIDPLEEDAAEQLLEAIDRAADGEDQVALRAGASFVPRLVRASGAAPAFAGCDPAATYLITGGLGALGIKTARWLAGRGARQIVLLGRTGLPERSAWATVPASSDAGLKIAAVQALEAAGAAVHLMTADAADVGQLARVLEEIRRTLPPLRGIVHAAGVYDGTRLRDMAVGDFLTMLRPKVAGAWNLHRLTESDTLDFFVLFSSISSLIGTLHLGHYAAANSFLDALADYRRAAGLPAVAVNWGAWEDVRGSWAHPASFARSGMRSMASAQAVAALDTAIGGDAARLVVASIDWATFKPVYEAKRRRPFLDDIVLAGAAAATPQPQVLVDALWQLDPDQRQQVIAAHVCSLAAAVIGLAPHAVPPRKGFFDLGMDSLMAVEIRRRLEASTGLTLPATLAFKYPTVAALTTFLDAALPMSAEPSALADDGLSEDQLATLLAEKLAQIR